MKKIILTLGLSTLITISNLSASDQAVTEPLSNESLTTQRDRSHSMYIIDSFPYPVYIKPFLIGRWDVEAKNDIDLEDLSFWKKRGMDLNARGHGSEIVKVKRNFGFGLAFGSDVSKYASLETSFSYYNHGVEYHQKGYASAAGTKYDVNMVSRTSINILNVMYSAIINISITNTTSLYCAAGIGISSIMFSDNTNNWDIKGSIDIIEGTEHRTGNILKEGLKDYRNEMMQEKQAYNNYESLSVVSWIVGAGVTINLTESIGLDIGYSYKSLGRLQTAAGGIPVDTHELNVGVKLKG